jgi:hypothetical protein
LADLNTQIVPVLQNIMIAIDGVPKVASSCCAVIHHVAENRHVMGGGADWFGPQFMQPMVEKLKFTTDREDWAEHNLRSVIIFNPIYTYVYFAFVYLHT